MVYPSRFVKLSFTGSLVGTDEIFSTALHLALPNADFSTAAWAQIDTAKLTAAFNAFATFWANPASLVPFPWLLEGVKAAYLDEEGKYLTDPKEEVFAPVNGSQGNVRFAAQLSLATATVSSKRKDPGKYNRMFIPTVAQVNPDSSLTTDQQTAYLAAFRTFINEINNIFSTLNSPPVVSVLSNNRFGGSKLPAVDVRVGTVIDTQRRRWNKLPENYLQISL